MTISGRLALGLCALGMMLGACHSGEDRTVAHPGSPSPTADRCRPGEPLKVNGAVKAIPSRCPTSEPQEVGYTGKIDLGSFWAPPPCNELPDFAGSWWRPVPPYPIHLKQAGHELISGTMTLITDKQARFEGPQVNMVMRHHTMRIPPKGRFVVDFKRVEGQAHVGGCD